MQLYKLHAPLHHITLQYINIKMKLKYNSLSPEEKKPMKRRTVALPSLDNFLFRPTVSTNPFSLAEGETELADEALPMMSSDDFLIPTSQPLLEVVGQSVPEWPCDPETPCAPSEPHAGRGEQNNFFLS